MDEREREICARVKIVRESLRWSQSAFAERLGIRKDQLASIEYGRTPLRYDIAWRLRLAFGISLEWLDTADTFPDNFEHDEYPIPSATGLPARALLSEVGEKFHGVALEALGPTEPETPDDIGHRSLYEDFLKLRVGEWIARLPDGCVVSFFEELCKCAEALLRSAPNKDDEATVGRRADEIMWHRIRLANARKVLVTKEFQKSLTPFDALVTSNPMKSQLANLLDRAARLAEQPGKKSELAKFVGAPLASVSRWLSRKREPGGEATLRLLKWIEQEKYLKK